uniref:TetR/AcrR family transcriptional regulator n=1 Tax=Breznakiella homolactica TaxID=2798577 RepID=A0A7T8BC87_9SPIR
MKEPNTELAGEIRRKTLNLLINKEPEEISMREIARECGVSATTLYYYYTDREALFEEVKRDCLAAMDRYIAKKLRPVSDPARGVRKMLEAFRDWCLAYPRIALLVMDRFKANRDAGKEELKFYYRSTQLGKEILDRAVAAGLSKSTDTLLDTSLCIAAIWGAVQSVLLNRTIPEYWDKGKQFTDRMIDLCCGAVLTGGGKK